MHLWKELKRRKVVQVAAIYAVVAWLIIQVVDVVNEPLRLPDWFDTVAIVLVAGGFPIAIVLGWAFEVTRTGIRKTLADEPGSDEDAAFELSGPKLNQTVKFCTAVDGVRLAYAQVGYGPPLVKTANWLSHLELDWNGPIWGHLMRDLAAKRSLTVYDERGNGLSDWDAQALSLDVFVSDLEVVIDAVGHERFALLGMSQGCAVSIAYAAKHPDRVTHLVLFGGFARDFRGENQVEAMATLIETGWARDDPTFRQLFTNSLVPDATREELNHLNELQRTTATPQGAARLFRAIHSMDVTEIAPTITVPTLVLHSRDEPGVPYHAGREMAKLIPGARFIGLESNNHILMAREPAYQQFKLELFSFLEDQ